MKIENFDAIKEYRKIETNTDVSLLSDDDFIKNTVFISNEIIANFPLDPDDMLIDVGCGYGVFLNLSNKKISNSVGVVPTKEQLTWLNNAHPKLKFVMGLAQNLPFNDNYANKLVCNSVLLLLDKTNVVKALQEFHRVVKNNGFIYIGEVPISQEFTFEKSLVKRAILVLKKYGFIQFTKSFFDVMREKFKEGKLTRMESHFFISSDDFISLAKENNLRFVSKFRHRVIDEYGNISEVKTRWNYIFTKEN